MSFIGQAKRAAFPAAVLAFGLAAAACGGGETATTAPAATEAPTTTAAPAATEATEAMTEATEAEMAAPTQLDVAMILLGVQEEPWYSTMIDAINRTKDARPYGLDLTLEVIENIAYADGERVIRELASSGEYEMIIAHSTYSDAIDAVNDDYPDIAFVFSGSGNEAVGGNGYWLDVFIHEPAYLAGIAAGMMTETNKISGVAAFPFPNVNGPLNAWIAGARSVNPDIEASVTYIESWFDPATAKESAAAQIAAGSDMVYAERFGPFEAVQEADGVYAFGHFSDQVSFAPDVALTGPIALWDPAFMTVVDAWWEHAAEGAPYDAPMERIIYYMADGGSDIGTLSDLIPDDVKEAVSAARSQILNGELEVEFDESPIE